MTKRNKQYISFLRQRWHETKINVNDLYSNKNDYHSIWERFKCFHCRKDCKLASEVGSNNFVCYSCFLKGENND